MSHKPLRFTQPVLFRLTLEGCQVCKDKECSEDSLTLIENACTDNTALSFLTSTPLSTSIQVNEYIQKINSEYSYQLAEFTLFQFQGSETSEFHTGGTL